MDNEDQLLGDADRGRVLIMKANQLGVTLIEVMTGLVVIGFLVMIAIPVYTQWNHNSQIRSTAESIKNGLQLAKVEAVKRNQQVDFIFNTTDYSWQVIGKGDATFTQQRPPAEGNKDATVTVTGGATVSFNGLGQSIGAGKATFLIENATGGTCGPGEKQMRCTQVEVQGSQIRMCLPSDVVPASDDPRKC